MKAQRRNRDACCFEPDHLPTDGEFYSNNCVDGHCIGCGECCTDLLPTTRREIVRLRDYAKKHQLKEHRLPAGAALESVDLTCPFRNEMTKRCEVYPVRPLICRAFICSRTLQAARKTRISSKVIATSTPAVGDIQEPGEHRSDTGGTEGCNEK